MGAASTKVARGEAMKIIIICLLFFGCTESAKIRACNQEKDELETWCQNKIDRLNAEADAWHDSFLSCVYTIRRCNCNWTVKR